MQTILSCVHNSSNGNMCIQFLRSKQRRQRSLKNQGLTKIPKKMTPSSSHCRVFGVDFAESCCFPVAVTAAKCVSSSNNNNNSNISDNNNDSSDNNNNNDNSNISDNNDSRKRLEWVRESRTSLTFCQNESKFLFLVDSNHFCLTRKADLKFYCQLLV